MATFEEIMKRLKDATNLVDLTLIEDDFVFDVAENATEAQKKQFSKAAEIKRDELLGKTPAPSEFNIEMISVKPVAPPKPTPTHYGQVEYGRNYVITNGKENPPFALPDIDFDLQGRWEYVPKPLMAQENIQLLNIPPKDITYYLPHVRDGKLYTMEMDRASRIRAAETMLYKYIHEGGSANLNQVFKSVNMQPLILDIGEQSITKIETLLYYQAEGYIFRKIYSFWGMENGFIRPVPITVLQ